MRRHLLAVGLAVTQLTAIAEAQQVKEAKIHRERFEWCDTWVENAHKPSSPRALLVGDSIVRGYYGGVAARLKGKVNLARFTTSAFVGDPMFLQQMDCMLKSYPFDVIHFNNGLHGSGYTEEEYKTGLTAALDRIAELQPNAKLVLVTSTPRRTPRNLKQLTDGNARVEARNRILCQAAEARKLAVNDLYGLLIEHPDYHSNDGTHFAQEGKEKQAQKVAEMITSVLGINKGE